MLVSLEIENVALIEKTALNLAPGLNIITGETGAGKSMVLDALSFVLGQKPPADFIRQGAQAACVRAVAECTDENKAAVLAVFTHIDEDNLLVIEREQTAVGKTSCRINGRTAPLGVLKDIAALLFDTHSQHEHQKLLNPAKHIDIIDAFCPPALKQNLSELGGVLTRLRGLDAEIAEIMGQDETNREQLIDLYAFQISEIEAADLKPNEDEALQERRRVINNAAEIAEKASAAYRVLAGGSQAASALDLTAIGQKALTRLAALDPAAAPFAEAADEIAIRLDDLARDVRSYENALDADPDALKEIEQRLDMLYNLKRKYGRTIEDILVFYEKTKARLLLMQTGEQRAAELQKERERLASTAAGIAGTISQIRKNAACEITSLIEQNLGELEMPGAVFSVSFTKREEITSAGADKVEFLLSANASEPPKPLTKIASGGEVSRVMLALKSALAHTDTAETLIFDEIDTGVSGRTAQKVAHKLKALSNARQLICVTHLPQIAAFANTHILIEKTVTDEGFTITHARNLDEDGTKGELSRLIGGEVITGQTEKAAAELRQMAIDVKM